MKRLWSFALSAALAAPVAAQVPEVTLDEAVRLALQVQPAMVQARGDQRTASAALRANTGSFLPSVSANGSSTRSGGSRYISDANAVVETPAQTGVSGALSANLQVFDGLQRLADRRAATASLVAADAGLVNQRFQVVLQTKDIFYTALASEALVRVAEAQLRRAEQQLQIAVEKLRAGSATRSDSLRSEVEHGNARLDLLRAQANLATARANLGRQIGVEREVRAVADTILPRLPDTAAVRVEAVAGTPAVRQAEAQLRAARAQLSASRAPYWPTFNVSVSTGYSGSELPWTSTQTFGDNWQWRFSLNWTLFNGFQRERQVVNAGVQRDIAEARAQDARRQASAQLTQQLASLANSYAAIDIARSNVAAATEDLRVQQERYRVGASTILDLLASQASLTNAEVSRIQTLYDYMLARAQLEATLGREL